ncbi:flagellin [Reinekea blandensis]|uniref:Flagellin n=1 Tax=Reinekea blandensis MED297 TaxID=314283 RepID=A4BEX5_9GAMM|nr:flagellin [Reinekea blandensis]EAR09310.1 Flagellin and related hook-associated protein [Reinekea sp. MED297] [Reinekea blandensis MED297]
MVGINTSTVQPAVTRSTEQVNQSFERISSGQRVNQAADDAAGIAIAEGFSAQRAGELQAIRNAGDGISLTQVASGTIDSLVDGVQRIRELSVQAANATYTDDDRALIQTEVEGIQEQIRTALEGAEFNGRSLFQNDEPQTFQVGPDAGDTLEVDLGRVTQQVLDAGLNELNVESQASASQSLQAADQILGTFSEASAQVGALQNQIESRVESLTESSINNAESESRIRDADLAREISDLTQNQIREEIGLAVQAQANERPRDVLQLISRV